MATPSAIRLNFSVLIPLDSCHTLAPHRMIDFDQHRMLSPLSISSSDVLINDSKFPSSSHLYLRQQHTVQIIQLVEGPPPSPRHIGSVINGSAASSSDCSTNDSTEDSESSDDDDDEESVCSSYCSSDAPPEHPESPRDDESTRLISGSPSQTYSLPWKRILDWRQNFSAPLSATLSGMYRSCSHPPFNISSDFTGHSLKRKIQIDGDDDRDDDDSVSDAPPVPHSRCSCMLCIDITFLQAFSITVSITYLARRRKRCLD
jgi:hypothetical protein